MVKKKLPVIWDEEAKFQLKEIIKYIRKESPQGAEKVKTEILQNTHLLGDYPETFSEDRFKLQNDGSFRAFTCFHYRVSYRITKNAIKILRVRHTSREPMEY